MGEDEPIEGVLGPHRQPPPVTQAQSPPSRPALLSCLGSQARAQSPVKDEGLFQLGAHGTGQVEQHEMPEKELGTGGGKRLNTNSPCKDLPVASVTPRTGLSSSPHFSTTRRQTALTGGHGASRAPGFWLKP